MDIDPTTAPATEPTTDPSTHLPAPAPRRLVRPRQGRVVVGVAAGIAAYAGVDVSLVRLVFALTSVFGGAGLAAYAIAWLFMPDEGADAAIGERLFDRAREALRG